MGGLRPWLLIILLIIFSVLLCCSYVSEARVQPRKLSPAVVVGTVCCDTCFQDEFSKTSRSSHYISGATVAVECEEESSRPAFSQKVKTDKQGKFKVHLPFSVSKHMKEIQGCTVKLVKSGEPYCAVASTANSSAIHLKETKQGKHIFSAGFFTFKPLKQPEICTQKPKNSNLHSFQGFYPHPQITTTPIKTLLPPLPELPQLPELPPLPPLPTLPSLPKLPSINVISIPQKPEVPFEKEVMRPQQFFFPPIISPPPSSSLPLPPNPLQPAPLLPNPLQPPPSPLIPNPFQPPAPPPSLLPPVPGLPPVPNLPSVPNLPPVPGVTNPPPPPPPPASSLPLPPLPPLIPGIPIPPASGNAKKTSP